MNDRESVGFLRLGVAGVVGGLVAVAATAIALRFGFISVAQLSQLLHAPPGGSSIVKVHGGCIHGDLTSGGWTYLGNGGFSATPNTTNDWISTINFPVTNLSNIQGTGGWMILISDSNGTAAQANALQVCSDSDCSINSAIGGGLVYLLPGRISVSLALDSNFQTVRFHDNARSCDNNTNIENPACDKIVTADIYTHYPVLPGHTSHQQLTCQTANVSPVPCEIDIGKP